MNDVSARVEGSRPGIAVFGASGHTGRFVVAELIRRGFAPIAVGRDTARLAEFAHRGTETRQATIEDPASLDRAFAGAAAVINCAGPFLDTAQPVAAAALRANAHYLDVTAEQPSARATLEGFDAAARKAGVAVLPAMGFYGGFADLLVTAAMDDDTHADEIRIGIALDSWHPTRGTRITGQRNTAPRLVVAGGTLAPLSQPAAETSWTFPEPFGRQDMVELPFSEIVLIARHLQTVELHTHLNRVGLGDIRNPETPPPTATDESGRSAQRFAVEAVVRSAGRERRLTASGRDIYAFSAPFVCEAVRRLVAGEMRDTGARAPGDIFDAPDFLRALTPENLAIDL